MGLLDQFIGGQPQGSSSALGSVVAAGAVLALLAHGMHRRQAAPAAQPGLGASLLGSLLGGQGGAGPQQNLISGLGGAGSLQALLDRFTERGYGSQVASWLGNGPNQAIQPQEVENALGPNVVSQLEQQTGTPRQSLLSELSTALPQIVDRLSPNGQLDENSLRSLTQPH